MTIVGILAKALKSKHQVGGYNEEDHMNLGRDFVITLVVLILGVTLGWWLWNEYLAGADNKNGLFTNVRNADFIQILAFYIVLQLFIPHHY